MSMRKGKYESELISDSCADKVRSQYTQEDIKNGVAIIGLSCRFPGADGAEQYWENIENRVSGIKEIPSSRWRWQDYYGDPKKEAGKTNVKWGGFIEDVDKFDPLFFNISPKEAAYIDPQHRLFLLAAWHAVEDAGYRISDFAGSKMGVYAGVSKNDYSEAMRESKHEIAPFVSTGTVHSILANRVSFLFDFRGRSEAIDTACSSSLVSLHNAIRDIHNGECDTALVGGVNALLTPTMYISHAKSGMLSVDGQCKSFDADANGYVRSEGVGIVLIKPLKNALEDRDQIYAVVKGSAVNHGGRANFLTSPRTSAQAEVVASAIEAAAVDVKTIAYIEAHGTGTPMGDPIEVNGLKMAFEQLMDKQGHDNNNLTKSCALSSAKSNVGHLECAAGMAGIVRVIQAMKYQKIPALGNFNHLNAYVEIDQSPFYIAENAVDWSEKSFPRRAGVSSFGMGGVNAHIVLEEPPLRGISPEPSNNNGVWLIPLSVRKTSRTANKDIKSGPLYEIVNSLLNYLRTDFPKTSYRLMDIGYTLQLGREEQDERLAIICSSVEDLVEQLQNFIDAPSLDQALSSHPQIFYNIVARKKGQRIDVLTVETNNLPIAAKNWVNGITLDWSDHYAGYGDNMPLRISLPGYPFVKKRCWFKGSSSIVPDQSTRADTPQIFEISGSANNAVEMSAAISQDNIFLQEHIVQGNAILPGVAYLELARSAFAEQNADVQGVTANKVTMIENVFWLSPLAITGEDNKVKIEKQQKKSTLEFNIAYQHSNCCSGNVSFATLDVLPTLHLQDIYSRCSQSVSRDVLYQLFRQNGLDYGDNFQVIDRCQYDENSIVSWLKAKPYKRDCFGSQALHPCLMDGVFQTITALSLLTKSHPDQYVPFFLRSLKIYKPLPPECIAYCRYVPSQQKQGELVFDASVIDSNGEVILEFTGLRKKVYKSTTNNITKSHTQSHNISSLDNTSNTKDREIFYYSTGWQKIPFDFNAKPPQADSEVATQTLIVFVDKLAQADAFKTQLAQPLIIVEAATAFAHLGPNHFQLNPRQLESFEAFFGALRAMKFTSAALVYMWQVDSIEMDDSSRLFGLLYLTQALISSRAFKQTRLAYIYSSRNEKSVPMNAAVAGFSRTLIYENPKMQFSSLAIDNLGEDDWANAVFAVLARNAETRLQEYRLHQRTLYQRTAIKLSHDFGRAAIEGRSLLKKGGVYLITGGLGGLGKIFSRHLLEKYNATLIILGRSTENAQVKSTLRGLSASSSCRYFSADIADQQSVANVFAHIRESFPRIDGVIHAAGIIEDAFILRKKVQSFNTVISPKIQGAINLDQITRDMPLDFFLVFSSIAALMPNQGQSDYASGNSFLDAFAEYRNALCEQRQRQGVSIAVNWPLWANGGMQVTPEEKAHLRKAFGMWPLKTEQGLLIFETILSLKQETGISLPPTHHIVAINGDESVIDRCLRACEYNEEDFLSTAQLTDNAIAIKEDRQIMSDTNTVNTLAESVYEKLENAVNQIVCKHLDIDADNFDRSANINQFGLDSIVILSLVEDINRQFEVDIKPPLLFEAGTVYKLSEILLKRYGDHLKGKLSSSTVSLSQCNASLIDIERSDSQKLLCVKKFQAELFYLKDHVVEGKYNMPGACYIEMGRQAAAFCRNDQQVSKLTNNYWISQLSTAAEDFDAYVEITPRSEPNQNEKAAVKYNDSTGAAVNNIDDYSVFSLDANGDRNVHAVGEVHYKDTADQAMQMLELNLAEIEKRCSTTQYPQQIYPQIIGEGLHVGETFQPMEKIALVDNEALAFLKLPDSIAHTAEEYLLHPSLLTGVFQTALISNRFENNNEEHYIPIGIDEIIVYDAMPANCCVYSQSSARNVKNKDLRKFDIQVSDTNGKIVAVLTGFALRALTRQKKSVTKPLMHNGAQTAHQVGGALTANTLMEVTQDYLKQILCDKLDIAVQEFDSHEHFESYGINSVMIVELNEVLEQSFGALSKTLFFEYRNLEELAEYFIEEHQQSLLQVVDKHDVVSEIIDGDKETLSAIGREVDHEHEMHVENAANTGNAASESTLVNASSTQNVEPFTLKFLSKILASHLELTDEELDPDAFFEDYGINSVMIVELNQILEDHFGALSKTLLFEYRNMTELAEYFVENYANTLQQLMSGEELIENVSSKAAYADQASASSMSGSVGGDRTTETKLPNAAEEEHLVDEDIAIIGLAARFPGASNVDEFWQLLKEGRDCITEVPTTHFDYRQHYDNNPENNKIYAKWGGFIEDVDAFDAIFFGITPREAELIDPQERLFLQVAWSSLEDAGYTRERLQRNCDGRVGVYVGALWQPYQSLGVEQTQCGNTVAPSGLLYSIANRVSYFLDICGPSLAIDTACSSSLTALHMACQGLRTGDSRMAIVGGVNLSLHSSKYLFLSQNRFLSTDGRCRSFGAGGDGYVPGEGVASLILKPLSKALADGDRIHALIKGSSINHGGRTHGYTVPNPNAQASLINETLTKAQVDPASINYIEAHGTGTSLGDPVEMTGLQKAFGSAHTAEQPCAIGSVKSNIGHLEAAAGLAGITKVVLQMQHAQLVPSLHSADLNTNINWQSTPFRVVNTLQAWPAPENGRPGDGSNSQRRAAVSSFGAGGANAHVILEEAPLEEKLEIRPMAAQALPQVMVFSAKSEVALKQLLKNFTEFVLRLPTQQLPSIAYTLQIGREAMPYRFAAAVNQLDALLDGISAYLTATQLDADTIDNRGGRPAYWCGKLSNKKQKTALAAFDLTTIISDGSNEERLRELAEAWVNGQPVDWPQLYLQTRPPLLSLPSYPFSKDRYWLPTIDVGSIQTNSADKPITPQRQSDIKVHFYRDAWQSAPLAVGQAAAIVGKTIVLHPLELDTVGFQHNFKAEDVYFAEFDAILGADRETEPSHFKSLMNSHPLNAPLTVVVMLTAEQLADETHLESKPFDWCRPLFDLVKDLSQRNNCRLLLLTRNDASILNATVLQGFCASLTNLGLESSCIQVEPQMLAAQKLAQIVMSELCASNANGLAQIHYRDDQRFAKTLGMSPHVSNENKEIDKGIKEIRARFKNGGVYWITGGAGQIGLALAEFLLQKYQARVILSGRSQLNTEKRIFIDTLGERYQGKLIYWPVDVSDRASVQTVLDKTTEIYGSLNGVIHAAGVFDENRTLHDKDWESFDKTLQPKIRASHIIDELTANIDLDFFVLFSSISALVGDFGQCDYALANGYLDSFAAWRNRRVRQGLCVGKTLSINWPLWREGGMLNQAQTQDDYIASTGLGHISNAQGVSLFEQCVNEASGQCTIFAGEPSLVESIFHPDFAQDVPEPRTQSDVNLSIQPAASTIANNANVGVVELFKQQIRSYISELTKLPAHHVDDDLSFSEQGIDSINLKALSLHIQEDHDITVKPNVFFAYNTVASLAEYITETYPSVVNESSQMHQADEKIPRQAAEEAIAPNSLSKTVSHSSSGATDDSAERPPLAEKNAGGAVPIAIVGMAGIMPGSNDLDEFWGQLLAGTDLISEVPESRWDWREYCASKQPSKQGSVSRWGGFIDDVACFDPLFFNLSPTEAEWMDPQHRLFLQTVWHTVENAGYRISDFKGQAVGVFAGVQFQEYQHMLLQQIPELSPHLATGNAHSMLSNRVSYLFDWNGPSESIDTACSSSLVAINRAVKSIQSGESVIAIAGGVSLALSPETYVYTSQMGILSPDGRCKTFDAKANGYVKGEGVGAVLLKPLDQAQRDGDSIYAVIRGISTSHGGRTSSLTAPSQNSQAKLIADLYTAEGIDPNRVAYIEAHGTGTELGDPVEVDGLKQAFAQTAQNLGVVNETGHCGIGSVKSNIGHLEPAAGIAGVFKVLQAMRHKTIPATLHVDQINPYIDLFASPFYIAASNREWPAVLDKQSGQVLPRTGAVSSFGFGGVNAHMVLEEYLPPANNSGAEKAGPHLIVLSAKQDDALQSMVAQLAAYLSHAQNLSSNHTVANIAYTLQVGREIMAVRLAFVVDTFEDLIDKLRSYQTDGNRNGQFIYNNTDSSPQGERVSGNSVLKIAHELFDDEDSQIMLTDLVKRWGAQGKWRKIAECWAMDMGLDWAKLYPSSEGKRVPLPGYAFAKEAYWLPNTQKRAVSSAEAVQPAVASVPRSPQLEPSVLMKAWAAKPLTLKSGVIESFFQNKLLVMLTNEYSLPLATALRAQLTDRLVVQESLLVNITDQSHFNGQRIDLNVASERDRTRLQEAIVQAITGVDSGAVFLLDLSDLAPSTSDVNHVDVHSVTHKLALYQSLIQSVNSAELHMLHLTQCLQAARELPNDKNTIATLSGATTASLVRMLGAEYSYVHARTIDVDWLTDEVLGDDCQAAVDLLEQLLANETKLSSQNAESLSEVCYRNGQRYAPVLKAQAVDRQFIAPNSTTQLDIDASGVYVVTGGTRGIGGQIVKHLVSLGARKFVIMGREALPEPKQWAALADDVDCPASLKEKLQYLLHLQQQGVSFRLFYGDLAEDENLPDFMDDVRQQLGPIRGVVHSAGVVRLDNPAFINKSQQDMEAVLAPKLAGLLRLHTVFEQDTLDFFTVFSSISALFPTLASGIADYAVANAFMDYFVQYQHQRGNGYYRAIQWPSWKETGMGENTNAAYLNLGFTAHTNAQGVKLFEHVLGNAYGPVCCPAILDYSMFDAQHMFSLQPLKGQTNNAAADSIAQSTSTEEAFYSDSDITQRLKDLFVRTLKIAEHRLQLREDFNNYGVDSIMLVQLVKAMEQEFGVPFDSTILLENTNLASLSHVLESEYSLGSPASGEQAVYSFENRSQIDSVKQGAPESFANLQKLRGIFAKTLKMVPEKLRDDVEFSQYGVDSILLAELVVVLEREFNTHLDSSIMLENPTLQRLHQALSNIVSIVPAEENSALPTDVPLDKGPQGLRNKEMEYVSSVSANMKNGNDFTDEKIAVIGIGCQFPGAPDKMRFWDNLASGHSSITEIPSDRWSIESLYEPTYQKGKSSSKWGGFIDKIQYFDPQFFGISLEDAVDVDPLERKFLEVSVAALHDAGYSKEELWGKNVGVFVGSRVANYGSLIKNHQKSSIVGLGQNFISAYLSHYFNLSGPNMVVDTACSSSLVSIHLACQSLLSGEVEYALAGGVDILLDERPYLILSEARALSATGKCHTFDRKADGFVPGEGAGAVLLKPLSKALASGDSIYGVIESSAVNNDGNTMGVTTPNPSAQQAVIKAALSKAQIDPATYSYVEAHGTGTMIGDPMELKSLTKTFRDFTEQNSFCGVGSVKSNIGHLLSAAGIASFIKVMLSIKHQQLPPTLNCPEPNERFEFSRSPFYINDTLRSWTPNAGVRRAGISGFGFGGTNAHIIVSDAADTMVRDYQARRQPLPPPVFNIQRHWPISVEQNNQQSNHARTDGGKTEFSDISTEIKIQAPRTQAANDMFEEFFDFRQI